MIDIDPASGRRIVTGAVAFASDCGIAPAKDYAKILRIFGEIDTATATETVPFGRNGRPVFIPGPKDSPSRVREVEKALERTRGMEGFDVDVAPQDRRRMARIIDALRAVTPGGDLDEEDAEDGLVIEHEDVAPARHAATHGDQT